MSLLKLTLIGNIGKDAEVREVSPGNFVISFNVAHTSKRRDASGVNIESTTWVSCNYWRDKDRLAIAQYLKKGTQVYVEGLPSVRTYVNKNGETVANMELRVNEVTLLGGPRNETGGNANNYSSANNSNYNSASTRESVVMSENVSTHQAPPPASDDDDLPF